MSECKNNKIYQFDTLITYFLQKHYFLYAI